MRIATDILVVLDDKAAEIGISRNELINQMIVFALENMEESGNGGSLENNQWSRL